MNSIPGVRAGWVERIQGVPVECERAEAMKLLRLYHEAAVTGFEPGGEWWRAEQVHGTVVAVVPGSPLVEAPDGLPVVPGADGLVTRQPGIVLAIYVADCGPIWLADRKTHAVGLVHCGKKGTAGNILDEALKTMMSAFGTDPADVVAVLGPCIRPPDYEIDFAADIAKQAANSGIKLTDCGLNTAADLERFYSYRRESGKTGRMMAMIALDF